jgi:ubiquitin-like domain-containing CTD phosphatase 1
MSLIIEIAIKWNGKDFKVNLLPSNCINDLKDELAKQTNVLPERQKLLGLKTKGGQMATNSTLLDDLNYKPNSKIMMMGTCEEKIDDVNKIPENLPEIIDDFDIEKDVEVHLQNREENLNKISKRVKDYKVTVFNEPRPNKKLLVLDIDYTIFDHVSHAERGVELMRPYLHEFLTIAYEDYDIAIWSATSLKWIEAKMNEIGVSKHPDYKIWSYLDCGAMISVYTAEYGLLNVKPLKVIWDKYPEFYSSKNTIMFDDLKRNFLMNPQNGLRIEPYKNAHSNREKDKELMRLSLYLKKISKLEDLSELKHRHWYKSI